MKEKHLKIKYAAAVLFWLLVWQALAQIVNRRLLIPVPSVTDTLAAFCRLCAASAFWKAVFGSVLRIISGFAAALVFGSVCAVAASRMSWFRILTAPVLALIRAIPVASFTILVFLWIARGRIPGTIAFFTVFPVIWANMQSGLMAADVRLTEMASVFGMSRGMILRRILLPGIRPHFRAAFVSGLGFAWKSGVAAEVICRTQDSLGNLLWAGKASVSYDEVFAVTLMIVLLSALFSAAASRWIREDRRGGRA